MSDMRIPNAYDKMAACLVYHGVELPHNEIVAKLRQLEGTFGLDASDLVRFGLNEAQALELTRRSGNKEYPMNSRFTSEDVDAWVRDDNATFWRSYAKKQWNYDVPVPQFTMKAALDEPKCNK